MNKEQDILISFAEDVKRELYYSFDEIVPSACSDVIDKILERYLNEIK